MQDHPQVQRRNKFSLTLFRFMTRSEIYTDKERLTGERHHFTAFFNLHRNLHKGMRTQRSNKNRKLLYHLDNKFVETDKTKDLGLQVANDENSKVCFYSLYSPKSHISSDKDIVYPPGTRKIPFIWEIYIFISGEKVRGKSEYPAYTGCLSIFTSKIISMSK